MLLQTQVGPSTSSDGTYPNARSGKLGDVIVSELNGRYYENTYRGNTFFAANTANQALSVASGTYTGLAVANPAGSGKNLVMLDVQFAISVAQTGLGSIVFGYAPTVALTTGNSSGPTGTPCLIGSGASSVAKVGASATLGAAPTIMRALAGSIWITANTSTFIAPVKDEIAGLVVVPPGQLVCIEATTTAVTGLASMSWVELPI
jgi:hypothetical protein